MNKYKFINDVVDGKKTHCHTLAGQPLLGTSSVVGVISKQLTWWSAELAAVECLEVGEKIPTIREEYIEAAKRSGPEKKKAIDALCKKYPIFKKARYAHYEKKNDSADSGTDMHGELESYIKDCLRLNNGLPSIYEGKVPQVSIFCDWAIENIDHFIVSEGYCYSERLWVGGITDCVAFLKNGQTVIIDFKSAKEAYISMFIQCVGYAIEIEENGLFDADGNQTMLPFKLDAVIVFPFGAEKVEPAMNYDMESLKKGFESACVLYKLINL